jgi:glycine cleavage system aminomethyltransferase T
VSDVPIARSALHSIYEAHAAEMAVRDGWQVPERFGPEEAELQAARTAVAVGECVDLGVLDLAGAELALLADRIGAGTVTPGAAAVVTLPDGAEARWLRLTHRHARLSLIRGVAARVQAALSVDGSCLHVTDVSSDLATLAVVGPRGAELLARLVRVDLDPRVFRDHQVAVTGAVGISLQVLRWDRGALLAYELTVGRDAAEYFWETLMRAGEGLGLQPIGVEALSRLTRG